MYIKIKKQEDAAAAADAMEAAPPARDRKINNRKRMDGCPSLFILLKNLK